jgi:hypothetical protein
MKDIHASLSWAKTCNFKIRLHHAGPKHAISEFAYITNFVFNAVHLPVISGLAWFPVIKKCAVASKQCGM